MAQLTMICNKTRQPAQLHLHVTTPSRCDLDAGNAHVVPRLSHTARTEIHRHEIRLVSGTKQTNKRLVIAGTHAFEASMLSHSTIPVTGVAFAFASGACGLIWCSCVLDCEIACTTIDGA